ncbi:TetR/AcrR family transcriptional regulator [Paenibacillus caseinilyticus]|uniref:Transcriptional regulator n=1 Tax=Paenibacillus mucilaginosus K02 TaxID=997761 RepID=I0BEC6_9BACL|nr:TetR/AcrR family transcriptional regulator [Paenibacillus mucilaginosus]AFH60723.1 transcriptional regulator [Paenibacillus mucilaginosus K02]
MNGFERRKQAKINQILAVAGELFLRHGCGKVSVNEIAAAAHVSPATIYNYFGTKEGLYAETLTRSMKEQLERCEAILRSPLPFPEKTKEILRLEAASLQWLTAELVNNASSETMQAVELFGSQKVTGFYRSFVLLGKQEGYIDGDLSDEMAIKYFRMFQDVLVRSWTSSEQEAGIPDLDAWLQLFFYGLAGSSGTTHQKG